MKNFVASTLLATSMALMTLPALAGSPQSFRMVDVPTDFSVTMSKKVSPTLSTKNITEGCSQLEKSVGLKADTCGLTDLSTLGKMAAAQDK